MQIMRRKRPLNNITRRIFCNCNSLFISVVIVILLQIVQISVASTIQEDYEECRDHEKFGNVSLICDPDHKLPRSTLRSLDNLLRDLQEKIVCECENGCKRGDGLSTKYIGLLIVTNSEKINALSEPNNSSAENIKALTQKASEIYEDAKLGNDECDNGLLILYIKDQQNLATYRGRKRFALLNDDDIKRLYLLARQGFPKNVEDGVALQYLLSGYDDKKHAEEGILRAESWAPVVGLTLALVIVLVIIAILLAFVLAKLCCCCAKKTDGKEKYYVNQSPSYKTIEPIYIVTPAFSQHDAISVLHATQNHQSSLHHSPLSLINGDYSIYNSPYGTARIPLPPPMFPPPPPIIGQHLKGPIVTHPPRSRSVTPTSVHRTKVRAQRSTSSTYGSQIIRVLENSPQNKSDRIYRTSTVMSRHSNATSLAGTPHHVVTPSLSSPESPIGEGGIMVTPHRKPQIKQPLKGQNSIVNSSSENEDPFLLPFLDPHRKREVQTKKEYIL